MLVFVAKRQHVGPGGRNVWDFGAGVYGLGRKVQPFRV